jgi:hypothetical protein
MGLHVILTNVDLLNVNLATVILITVILVTSFLTKADVLIVILITAICLMQLYHFDFLYSKC